MVGVTVENIAKDGLSNCLPDFSICSTSYW